MQQLGEESQGRHEQTLGRYNNEPVSGGAVSNAVTSENSKAYSTET